MYLGNDADEVVYLIKRWRWITKFSVLAFIILAIGGITVLAVNNSDRDVAVSLLYVVVFLFGFFLLIGQVAQGRIVQLKMHYMVMAMKKEGCITASRDKVESVVKAIEKI